jgi:outer membrane lipoprotein SlyB
MSADPKGKSKLSLDQANFIGTSSALGSLAGATIGIVADIAVAGSLGSIFPGMGTITGTVVGGVVGTVLNHRRKDHLEDK